MEQTGASRFSTPPSYLFNWVISWLHQNLLHLPCGPRWAMDWPRVWSRVNFMGKEMWFTSPQESTSIKISYFLLRTRNQLYSFVLLRSFAVLSSLSLYVTEVIFNQFNKYQLVFNKQSHRVTEDMYNSWKTLYRNLTRLIKTLFFIVKTNKTY